MFPRLMVCIDDGRHTIYIALPLDTPLEYRQQVFFTPTIVALRQSVLTTMICNRVQTIIILLQQTAPVASFYTLVSITNGF